MICECDSPKPPRNAQGKIGGNICQECGNKILTPAERARELGALHVRLDGAIASLGLEGDEKGSFIAHMAQSIDKDVKHKFQTWDHNREVAKRRQT